MQRFEAGGCPRDEPQVVICNGSEVGVSKYLELLQVAEADSGILQDPMVDLIRGHGERGLGHVDGRQFERLEAVFPEQIPPSLCGSVSQGNPRHGEGSQVAALCKDLEDLCVRLSRVEAVEPETTDMLCKVGTL